MYVYVRSIVQQQKTKVRLLCSKTRVAPLKLQTIPRLELCAALTLARLMKKVVNSLNTSIDKIVYWSDSTIVLNWQTQPNQLQVFVANRVSEIQELTDCITWRHVPTQENPALLSRNLLPNQLQQSTIWWQGPSFLASSEDEWPAMPNCEATIMEQKRTVCTAKQIQITNLFLFSCTTNLNRLIRVIAYCKRFVTNCKNKHRNKSMNLTSI